MGEPKGLVEHLFSPRVEPEQKSPPLPRWWRQSFGQRVASTRGSTVTLITARRSKPAGRRTAEQEWQSLRIDDCPSVPLSRVLPGLLAHIGAQLSSPPSKQHFGQGDFDLILLVARFSCPHWIALTLVLYRDTRPIIPVSNCFACAILHSARQFLTKRLSASKDCRPFST